MAEKSAEFVSCSSKDKAIVQETWESFRKFNIDYWTTFENQDYDKRYASQKSRN